MSKFKSVKFICSAAAGVAAGTILVITLQGAFAAGSGDHHHDQQEPQRSGSSAGHHGSEAHSHDEWIHPPERYEDLQSDKWADISAIAEGEKIYQQYCQKCHGEEGKGAGPIARSLKHKPADLNNHFHRGPGAGDAYLFWRVSKGGTVEPFRSRGSAMPAFEDVLTREERWNVLAYIHAFFHLDLDDWEVSSTE